MLLGIFDGEFLQPLLLSVFHQPFFLGGGEGERRDGRRNEVIDIPFVRQKWPKSLISIPLFPFSPGPQQPLKPPVLAMRIADAHESRLPSVVLF